MGEMFRDLGEWQPSPPPHRTCQRCGAVDSTVKYARFKPLDLCGPCWFALAPAHYLGLAKRLLWKMPKAGIPRHRPASNGDNEIG